MSSQDWSDKGKAAFLKKDYKDALQCYNQAIELDNTRSVYYSNRSRVYKLLGNLDDGLKDAEKSTELDIQNIKGHLLIGQIIALMCQQNHSYLPKLDTCIVRLTKALTLCAGQKMQKNEKYLEENIRRVKKLKWFIENKQQKEKDEKIIEFLIVINFSFLNQFGLFFFLVKCIHFIEGCQILMCLTILNSLFYWIHFSVILKQKYPFKKQKVEGQQEEAEDVKKKQIQLLRETLIEEEIRSIPEYFLCKLSKKILKEPMTTKYSNTYEKKDLDDYFVQAKSIRDPSNQQLLLNPSIDILPNISLKKSIEEYIDINPWAFEFKENQTIEDMEF